MVWLCVKVILSGPYSLLPPLPVTHHLCKDLLGALLPPGTAGSPSFPGLLCAWDTMMLGPSLWVSVVNGGGGITRFSKTVPGCSLSRCPVGSHSGQRGNFPLMSRQQWSYYIHVRVCVCCVGCTYIMLCVSGGREQLARPDSLFPPRGS